MKPTAALLLVSIGALPALSHASGNTTHAAIGELALHHALLQSDLGVILRTHKEAFRTGVMHPDVAEDDNFPPTLFPEGSPNIAHMPKQAEEQREIRNWPSEYLKILKHQCPEGINNQRCEIAVAFLFGAVTHMVSDARFDEKFVGSLAGSSGHCPQLAGLQLPNRWREQFFADKDLDICLSKYLNSRELFDGFVSVDFVAAARRDRAARPTAKRPRPCPAGQQLRRDGFCWGCPREYGRTNFPIAHKRACTRAEKRCKLLEVTAIEGWTEPPLPKAPVIPLAFVTEAYRAAGYPISAKALETKSAAAIPYYRTAEPKAPNSQFQPKNEFPKLIFRCGWGLRNFSSAEGGLEDSASTVAEFLAKLWEYVLDMYDDQGVPVLRRAESRLYRIERGGEVLYP